MNRSKSVLFPALALAWAGLPSAASACATCFGASDSKLAQGMNMGILSLLVVVVLVLGAFGTFFVYLARRAAMTSQLPVVASETAQTTQ
jgi:hypothetical protein